jgi:malate/lactate dehydrogenase
MEINDSNFMNMKTCIGTIDPIIALQNADVAILLGGFPRLPGMERADLIEKNITTLVPQIKALDEYASSDCQVIVVANPANTNCLVALSIAQNIPVQNFTCLTKLDEDRARGMLASQMNIHSSQLCHVAIYGNHSTTMVPFIRDACMRSDDKLVPIAKDTLSDIETIITPLVQKRGAEVLNALGASSALSAAQATAKHVRYVCLDKAYGADEIWSDINDTTSLGVLCGSSTPNLGLTVPLVFSQPHIRSHSSNGSSSSSSRAIPYTMSVDPTDLIMTRDELMTEATMAYKIVKDLKITLRSTGLYEMGDDDENDDMEQKAKL